MDKLWTFVIIIALVLVATLLLVIPNYDKLMGVGNTMISKTTVLDSALNDSQTTVGTSVRQAMSMAKSQGTGFLITGTSGLTTATTNGAVDFSDTGAYTTGKLYVVVNVLPAASGTYIQSSTLSDIDDNATFKQIKRMDANGKINRITFTQVDQGK